MQEIVSYLQYTLSPESWTVGYSGKRAEDAMEIR